jgi:hypothetical protein
MHGELLFWGRTDTILAVVRKDSESMQTPLALSRKMLIIVCTVILSEKKKREMEREDLTVASCESKTFSLSLF